MIQYLGNELYNIKIGTIDGIFAVEDLKELLRLIKEDKYLRNDTEYMDNDLLQETYDSGYNEGFIDGSKEDTDDDW